MWLHVMRWMQESRQEACFFISASVPIVLVMLIPAASIH